MNKVSCPTFEMNELSITPTCIPAVALIQVLCSENNHTEFLCVGTIADGDQHSPKVLSDLKTKNLLVSAIGEFRAETQHWFHSLYMYLTKLYMLV